MIRLGKFLKEMLLYSGAEQIYKQTIQQLQSMYGINASKNETVAKVNYLLARLFWNQGIEILYTRIYLIISYILIYIYL